MMVWLFVIEQCEDIQSAFALLASFRVLCATRQGDYGVEILNEKIKGMLGKNQTGQRRGTAISQSTTLYHGQPIIQRPRLRADRHATFCTRV